MDKMQETTENFSSTPETTTERKIWETPKLRILSVPARTQGGTGNQNDQDDQFYRS